MKESRIWHRRKDLTHREQCQLGIPLLHCVIDLLNKGSGPFARPRGGPKSRLRSCLTGSLAPLSITRHGIAYVLNDIVAKVIQRLVLVGVCYIDVVHGDLVCLELLAIVEIAVVGEVGADVSETVGQSNLAFVSFRNRLIRGGSWRKPREVFRAPGSHQGWRLRRGRIRHVAR